MNETPKVTGAELENSIARWAGGIILGMIALAFILVREYEPERPHAQSVALERKSWSRFAHDETGGPFTIGQDDWFQCPTIDSSRQKISVNVQETTVWIDWMIDGHFYREKLKCFPSHHDVDAGIASSIWCRITPGTSASTATVSWTITDYTY